VQPDDEAHDSINANQVMSLIKELLILNRAESALAALPPNPEQLEQWQCERKRIRQALVQAFLASHVPAGDASHEEPH